jgi:hypothetical protein
MAKTITSANASFILALTGLFPAPIQISGFAADDMFSTDPQKPTEVVMGVDGKLSGGFVKHQTVMKIKLSPDSNALYYFDAWVAAQNVANDAFSASATITMPGNGSKYLLVNGWITSYKNMPDAKKLLQAQEIEITWESVTKVSM